MTHFPHMAYGLKERWTQLIVFFTFIAYCKTSRIESYCTNTHYRFLHHEYLLMFCCSVFYTRLCKHRGCMLSSDISPLTSLLRTDATFTFCEAVRKESRSWNQQKMLKLWCHETSSSVRVPAAFFMTFGNSSQRSVLCTTVVDTADLSLCLPCIYLSSHRHFLWQ